MRRLPLVLGSLISALSACGPGYDPATTPAQQMGPLAYSNRCLMCHGATGSGMGTLYPPLAGSDIVQGDPVRLAAIVTHGLVGPVEIKGQRFDGTMPPHGQFDDRELAAILTFVRGSWGNQATAVTEADIQAGRALGQGRSKPWTVPELSETLRVKALQTDATLAQPKP